MKIDFVFLASLCANSALVSALPADTADKATLLLEDGTTQTISKRDLAANLPGVALSPPTNSLPEFIETGSDDSTPYGIRSIYRKQHHGWCLVYRHRGRVP